MYMFSKQEAALGLPRLAVRFLADSNSWIVDGTPNLRTVRQMLLVLSQLTYDNFLASVLFCTAHFIFYTAQIFILHISVYCSPLNWYLANFWQMIS